MNVDLSKLAPTIWFLAAFLVVVVAFIAIRFFWRHILKYIIQGCLVIVGIIILLAVLHYFKVF
jgi:fumarate reductase subunit C